MVAITLTVESALIVWGASMACWDAAAPGMPSSEVSYTLLQAFKAAVEAGPGSDTSAVDVPEDLVDDLVRLIPACLEWYGDDHAEMSAVMDCWPDEAEAAQAELLAALGR